MASGKNILLQVKYYLKQGVVVVVVVFITKMSDGEGQSRENENDFFYLLIFDWYKL